MDGKCKCVAEHQPEPPYFDQHHIDPLSRGGPDVPANKTTVCPSTHVWIHKFIETFEKAGRIVPYQSRWPRHAYTVAVDGWERGERRTAARRKQMDIASQEKRGAGV